MSRQSNEPRPRKGGSPWGLIAAAGVLLLVLWFFSSMSSPSQFTPSGGAMPTARPVTTTLQTRSGQGDDVGPDFTVPTGCSRQVFSYEAEQTDRDDGWVNFRVPFVDGRGAESLGPSDVADAPTGSALWTLAPGSYAIEVTGWHAAWSYTLKCR